ncbi:hypothetical protein PI124_g18238 [Phytophthora idaei]|nr:hypothetical protein PI124_g18238 [Phytophthora idaei]
MELKPELAQRLSKKKGKRQAVSLVDSVRRTKRAESPIYSPTSPASDDKDADENQGRVVRSVNGVSVPVTPQQLQLQPAQAVQSVQPLQLVQPTQLMQSTQYVHHDVGVTYGWRAPAVGAVQRQWEGNQAKDNLLFGTDCSTIWAKGFRVDRRGLCLSQGTTKVDHEWIHLCQGITIKTATLSHNDAKDLKRDRMTEDCTEVNDKDLKMYTEFYLNEDTRLCLVEKSGENQYVGELEPAGLHHVDVHHQEDQSHNGVATHHREALLDRSFVGVRRLGDVLCHDGHRRVGARRQEAVLDCVGHQREDDRH